MLYVEYIEAKFKIPENEGVPEQLAVFLFLLISMILQILN